MYTVVPKQQVIPHGCRDNDGATLNVRHRYPGPNTDGLFSGQNTAPVDEKQASQLHLQGAETVEAGRPSSPREICEDALDALESSDTERGLGNHEVSI